MEHAQSQPGHESAMDRKPDFMPRFAGNGRLAGKVALISGGDSGIGRAVAVLFAREGADVAIAYLDEQDDAGETRALIEREGRSALLLAGDVGDPGRCRSHVAQVLERFGRIDVLVNNCAEQHVQHDLTDITPEQLVRTFTTNVFSYFYMTAATLPHLGEGSAIVNTTSVTAYRGSEDLIDYSATRGAIVAFTRSLSQSLVDRKIRVNGVAPGPIWTPLIPASFEGERLNTHGQSAPMKRAGEPWEVATCHLFLACDESAYMTGQVLHPNGGSMVGS